MDSDHYEVNALVLLPSDMKYHIMKNMDLPSARNLLITCKAQYTMYQFESIFISPIEYYIYTRKKRLATLIFCAQKQRTELFNYIIKKNETDVQKEQRKEILTFFGYRQENNIHQDTLENNLCAYQAIPLLEKRKDGDVKNRWLIKALYQNCMPAVTILLANGADSNSIGDNNMSALCIAAERNLLSAMYQLIKRKANINHQTQSKNTPLHYAVLANKKEAVELLLRYSANTLLASDDGTPLSIAQSYGYTDICKLLQPL